MSSSNLVTQPYPTAFSAWWQRSARRMFGRALFVLVGLGLAVGPGAYRASSSPQGPALTTDKPDYTSGETVVISGSGFQAGAAYDLPVIRPDGSMVTGDGSGT